MAKDDQNQDEKSAAVAQEEAKESSQMGYFSRLKIGYNRMAAQLKAREGDRTATQSVRPMKNTPVDPLAVGLGVDARGDAALPLVTSTSSDSLADQVDDTGDAGDTGTASGSGDSSGGGPSPALAPDAGYVSFADTAVETKVDVKDKAQKQNQDLAEQKTDTDVKVEGKKSNDGAKAKAGVTSAAPKSSAPAPSSGGGKGGSAPPTP
jgi:hypothetical protein